MNTGLRRAMRSEGQLVITVGGSRRDPGIKMPRDAESRTWTASFVGWGSSLVGMGDSRESALADLAFQSEIPTATCKVIDR